MQLTRTHRILIGVVVAGAVVIAAIGFAGSYSAVRDLAEKKGFGDFSLVFPIGIDAGICVLLALDLLLTWIRIPFPLLRQTAWLLTAATIAFNGAAAWPDPLGVGMHAVIPVLFVVAVEAARHAVGRIADITADKHMEGVRLTRWLLSPVPTFRLWRRMKLWELRSYEQVIKLEQDRLIYQARLQARFGRAWRRKAPVEALMPLRLAKYGVPLAETAPAGLAAAGIEPALLPPNPTPEPLPGPSKSQSPTELPVSGLPAAELPAPRPEAVGEAVGGAVDGAVHGVPQPEDPGPAAQGNPWFSAQALPQDAYEGAYDPTYDPAYDPALQTAPGTIPAPRTEQQPMHEEAYETAYETADEAAPAPRPEPQPDRELQSDLIDERAFAELAYPVFKEYVHLHGVHPSNDQLDITLADAHGIQHPRSASLLRRLMPEFQSRYQADLEAEHIA
ncbi:DUF2637 domain-containing protein [Streptomyces sp. NPDC000410]|uniref:DUF2637 domain-containing protein n=1 Tax=Streptomyces sp. NPDC000410 TaxID=3154254 RepID=UPI0033166D0B